MWGCLVPSGVAGYVPSAAALLPSLPGTPAHGGFRIPSRPGAVGTAALSDLVPRPGDHGGCWCWVRRVSRSQLGSVSLPRISKLR